MALAAIYHDERPDHFRQTSTKRAILSLCISILEKIARQSLAQQIKLVEAGITH